MTEIYLPHEAVLPQRLYTCWPAEQDYWPTSLDRVWEEFAAFLMALGQADRRGRRLPITVLAASGEAEAVARQRLGSCAQIIRRPYGDVWTRDTGPVFLRQGGVLRAIRFEHNGWGGKYLYPGDRELGAELACHAGAIAQSVDLVAEGGALEFDGEGTLLTTRQCLLNSNRNPGLSESQVEARLIDALGVERVLWIDEGMVADHTDGHIDNIVRFVRPGVVVCQQPADPADRQARVFRDIYRQLQGFRDARGRRLQVLTIPGPGRVEDDDGDLLPASYLNWVMGAGHLIVPTYGTASENRALSQLRRIFRQWRVEGLRANAILTGGGAFHCVTCHVPGVPE